MTTVADLRTELAGKGYQMPAPPRQPKLLGAKPPAAPPAAPQAAKPPTDQDMLRLMVDYRYNKEVTPAVDAAVQGLRELRALPVMRDVDEVAARESETAEHVAKCRADLVRAEIELEDTRKLKALLEQKIEPEMQRKRQHEDTIRADESFGAVCTGLGMPEEDVFRAVKRYFKL